MKRLETITVVAALDDRDATTLRAAAWLAAAAQTAQVHVAHVAPTFELSAYRAGDGPNLVVHSEEELAQALHAAVAPYAGEFPAHTELRYQIRRGSIVPEVVRLIARQSADLVCVGRSAGTGYDALNEAAVRIVRKSPCSVFLIPPATTAQYRRIVVPVDFSEHSRDALEVAMELAAAVPGAELTALHVYRVPSGYHKTGQSQDAFAANMRALAERQWSEFAAGTRAAVVAMRLELGEHVPNTILAVADELDADRVVMASHGRTGPAGLLLGHVAESVASRCTRPLWCVKRKGEVVNLLHGLLQLFELESRD